MNGDRCYLDFCGHFAIYTNTESSHFIPKLIQCYMSITPQFKKKKKRKRGERIREEERKGDGKEKGKERERNEKYFG